MQHELRNAFLAVVFGASLISSARCSTATAQVSTKPDCHDSTPPGVIAGKDCKDIEAPILVDCVHPSYPTKIRREKLQGKVVAEAVLGADGKPDQIKIVSSPAGELSNLALAAFREWRYKPAFCRDSGKNVRVGITMTATFSLDGRVKT